MVPSTLALHARIYNKLQTNGSVIPAHEAEALAVMSGGSFNAEMIALIEARGLSKNRIREPGQETKVSTKDHPNHGTQMYGRKILEGTVGFSSITTKSDPKVYIQQADTHSILVPFYINMHFICVYINIPCKIVLFIDSIPYRERTEIYLAKTRSWLSRIFYNGYS